MTRALSALPAIALLAIAPLASAAHAQAPAAAAVQPDFSRVENLAAAQALAREDKLVPVLLFPAEVGGPDVPPNTVYITPEAAAERARAIATIIAMLEEDKLDQMDVKPVYKGESVVPSSIVMKAWHTATGETFDVTIPVW